MMKRDTDLSQAFLSVILRYVSEVSVRGVKCDRVHEITDSSSKYEKCV